VKGRCVIGGGGGQGCQWIDWVRYRLRRGIHGGVLRWDGVAWGKRVWRRRRWFGRAGRGKRFALAARFARWRSRVVAG
jgi:hypothetical protein